MLEFPPAVSRRASVARSRRVALVAAALVVGCVAAASVTLVLARASGARLAAADPDLARLMRAMAVIKAVILALAIGGLLWRARRPVAAPVLAAYLALPWVAAAALGAMWQLAALGWVTVALHGAGIALLVAAWCDRDFLPVRREAPARPMKHGHPRSVGRRSS